MSRGKASALTGYIVAAVLMIPFFWLTLGDAYGRFIILFNPEGSTASYYLAPFTGHLTALICLSAPLLLAYLLKSVVAHWVDVVWEVLSEVIDWLLVNGKKAVTAVWRRGALMLRKRKDSSADNKGKHS